MCFIIFKHSGDIFIHHLLTECDIVESFVVMGNLVILNDGILYDHTYLGQLWSDLAI